MKLPRCRAWLQRRGTRLGPYYVGTCSRKQHITILRSGKGTYCAWHRLLKRVCGA